MTAKVFWVLNDNTKTRDKLLLSQKCKLKQAQDRIKENSLSGVLYHIEATERIQKY